MDGDAIGVFRGLKQEFQNDEPLGLPPIFFPTSSSLS